MVYIGKQQYFQQVLGSWRSYPYLLIGIGMAGEAKISISKSTMTTDRARPTKHRSHFCQSTHYLSIQTSAEDNRPWYRKLISPIVSFGVEIVASIHPSCFYQRSKSNIANLLCTYTSIFEKQKVTHHHCNHSSLNDNYCNPHVGLYYRDEVCTFHMSILPLVDMQSTTYHIYHVSKLIFLYLRYNSERQLI